MAMFINGNPTRERILLLLKKSGSLSIDDLSIQLGITPMGIRQHLLSLERKGVVDYFAKRHGVGRPAFLYRLTDKADDLFPKAYHEFIVNALKDLEENEGRDKIDDIFRWRKERILREKREVFSDKKDLHDKVHALKDILGSDGYLVDLGEDESNYILRQFNCPILKVASQFREACRYELQIYRDLLRKDVMRQQCISEGSPSCTYVIPKTPVR
ncbi:MAG: transcriptional regulator [Thermodesulfovibrionales bacterium]|nr:transcriptional regulator [Thermodesulfovibrionales bacterium]